MEDVSEQMRYVAVAAELPQHWNDLSRTQRRALLQLIVKKIELYSKTVEITIYPSQLPALLEADPEKIDRRAAKVPAVNGRNEPTLTLSVAARLKRAGMEMRLLIDGAGGGARTKSDYSLCRLLARAHQFQAILLNAQQLCRNTVLPYDWDEQRKLLGMD